MDHGASDRQKETANHRASPGLHLHLLDAVLGVTETVLLPHEVQAAVPVADLYLPLAHALHVPPLGPV
jgi:hypothetical protein